MTAYHDQRRIRFPDGSSARWRYKYEKGTDTKYFKEWFTTADMRKPKESSVVFDMFSNKPTGTTQQHLIIADFDCHGDQDKLSDVLTTGIDVTQKYENAILFKTASGNPKIGFVVESDRRPNAQQARAYLALRLPDHMHWYDSNGLNRLHINNVNVSSLEDTLHRCSAELVDFTPATSPTTKRSTDRTSQSASLQLAVPAASYRFIESHSSQIPAQLQLWAKDAKRRQLLTMLTACWGLLGTYNLPQSLIASQLNCSITHAGQLLKELRQLGVLVLLDKTFVQGKKAQTYRAAGCLYKAIQQHKTDYKKGTAPKQPLPTHIEKGQFYVLCLRTLGRFQTNAAFLQYIDTLHGLTPVRRQEAVKYSYHHFQKNKAA
jgi:hypothetical protein